MKTIYFIHQTAPAQFKHLIQSLLASNLYTIVVVSMATDECLPRYVPSNSSSIYKLAYRPSRASISHNDTKLVDIDAKLIRAESIYSFLIKSIDAGYPQPDLIYVHPGWGESLYLSDLYPGTPQIHYCEYYYSATGRDTNYGLPSATLPSSNRLKPLAKNILNCHSLIHASALVSPTQWQANTYPCPYNQHIEVIHDGIDTQLISRHCGLPFSNSTLATLHQSDRPTIVYVNRAFERIRGSHIFLSALPHLLNLDQLPNICVVGGERTQRPYGQISREWHNDYLELLNYVKDFPGQLYHFPRLKHQDYHQLLNLSSCNLYLSSPFVLSWSLLEMMAIARPIAASSTEPVLEFLNKDCAELFEYHDHMGLVASVASNLSLSPSISQQRSTRLRTIVSERASLHDIVIPRHLELLHRILKNAKA